MGAFADELSARAALPIGMTVDEAADILWLLIDPHVYYRLVIERGWSADRYEAWFGNTLIAMLVRPDYVVTDRPEARQDGSDVPR
jgi:hypothetical protein